MARLIPAAALRWPNVQDVYAERVDEWDESEVAEWVDSVYDDLEDGNLKALPHEGGDKLVILRAREQSLLQVKRLQSVFGALLRDGIGLRKVNDQILRQRGVDAISRKVVLRHVEALLGAPPPPPRIGSMPALLLLEERAAVGNGAANGASGAIKLVIVLGEIRRGLDKDLFSLCDEMVRYEEAGSEEEALKSVVSVSAQESVDPDPPPPAPPEEENAKKKKKKKQDEDVEAKKAIAIGQPGGEVSPCFTFEVAISDPKPLPSGLKWEEEKDVEPGSDAAVRRQGVEIMNSALGRELKKRREFTEQEWAGFGVRGLTVTSYIKVGDRFFKPSAPGEEDKIDTYVYRGTLGSSLDTARTRVIGLVSQRDSAGRPSGLNLEISFFKSATSLQHPQ